MYASSGHLVFSTGPSYNISFKTENGGINLNDKDLLALTAQVTYKH